MCRLKSRRYLYRIHFIITFYYIRRLRNKKVQSFSDILLNFNSSRKKSVFLLNESYYSHSFHVGVVERVIIRTIFRVFVNILRCICWLGIVISFKPYREFLMPVLFLGTEWVIRRQSTSDSRQTWKSFREELGIVGLKT